MIDINPVQLFVKECCELGTSFECDYLEFYKNVNRYRKSMNVASISKTMITQSLEKLDIPGFVANKKIDKKYHPDSCGRNYVGLKIKKQVIDELKLIEDIEQKPKKIDEF